MSDLEEKSDQSEAVGCQSEEGKDEETVVVTTPITEGKLKTYMIKR